MDGDTYCGNCGQKHHKGKHSISKLLSDFFATSFNLDGRIFRTIGGLLRPGFLTIQYFRGKHKRYNTPIQVFLVIAVIFFSLVGWMNNNSGANKNILQLRDRITKKRVELKMDSILTDISSRTNEEDLKLYLDTLSFVKTKESVLLDSLPTQVDSSQLFGYNFKFEDDTLYLLDARISAEVILENDPKEIIEEYFPDRSWSEKVLLRQGLKFGLDQSTIIKLILSRLPIFILLVTPFFALLLKLLYLRRGFYFVEHFVFTLHLNSAGIFLSFLAYAISYGNQDLNVTSFLALLLWILYFFLAMKYFYGQGWIKTIFKFILALFLGTFVTIFATLLILGLAFLIF